jgi:uncharacterized membrane protein (GlpM family)
VIPDAEVFRLAASFVAGFIIVAAVTALADLAGEGQAGFIGGIPSSGAVALLSIGLTQSTSAAIKATTLFPLGFSVTFAFLLFYTMPERMGFWARMSLSLCLWFLTAVAAALWGPNDFALSLAASIVIASAVLLARSRIPTDSTGRSASEPGARRTILRGALGGLVVTAVVLLSEVAGPLVGGVFAAAPAIWSSSLYVTSRAHGIEFSRSLTWKFMQTGALTIIPFAVAARYFFSVAGIWLGTLLAYVTISPLAYVAWKLTNR